MTNRTLDLIGDQVEQYLLPVVRQPARYIGGEINQAHTDLSTCDVRVALCFPDAYEVAMSHAGIAILYDILNQQPHMAAERVFSPWLDAEAVMRIKGIPLFSLESKACLRSFDIVGFCLTNELCYTNVLNMLDLGGLALRSVDRVEEDPLVIAGGGMAHCCEPMADYIDAFVLGDGEEAAVVLAERWCQGKQAGQTKTEILAQIALDCEWLYVPQLYEVSYKHDKLVGIKSRLPELTPRRDAVVKDFETCPMPDKPLVPFVEAIHERVSIEIMRGCPGRCRFCQVSYCKRPIRIRSVDRIVEQAKRAVAASGFDTVSLLSLSSAEYPHLEELLERMREAFAGQQVGISVPSLRVDRQLQLLPRLLTSVRKAGLTMAVEAASERLRTTVNKAISDEDLFAAVDAAYAAGWQRIKLYFMVGLPGETEEDIRRIVSLTHELAKRRRAISGSLAQLNVAISWFVPKAQTPFAWVGQQSQTYFEKAKTILLEEQQARRARCLTFKFHDTERSTLESVLGRGDRRLGPVIETAWRAGARFDLWNECFDFSLWKAAFAEHQLDLARLAEYHYGEEDFLAWEHLGGPDKEYLLEHYRAAHMQ